MILIAAAGLVWLALVATRRRTPMLIGSAILAAAWLAQIETPGRGVVHASSVPFRGAPETRTTPHGSCASIAVGMSAAEVKARMGEADEVRGDEETRGPGASMMIYRSSRCAVHLLDGNVEFIE